MLLAPAALAEHVAHFETFGYLHLPLLSPEELDSISTGFARGMRTARGGAADPSLAQDEETGYSTEREQVVPFFDFEPELLYPLLDHEGINQVSSRASYAALQSLASRASPPPWGGPAHCMDVGAVGRSLTR